MTLPEGGAAPDRSTTLVRRIGVQAVVSVLALVVALLGAEGVLRLQNRSMRNYDMEMWKYSRQLKVRSPNPALGHEHRPSTSALLQSTEIRINELGLRGGPTPPVVPGKRRILVLGSSIALGWGVPEADVFSTRLQDMFARAGQELDVLNAGIGNYNTTRYVELFLTRLTDIQPTDIVVQYFLNDAEVLPAGGGNLLLEHSQLAATLWATLRTRRAAAAPGGLDAHYARVYTHDAVGYVAMCAALSRLAAYAGEADIQLYLVMMPDLYRLERYPYGDIHDDMRDVALERGYTFIDLLPSFEGLRPEDIWCMPGDAHPNARGHALIAEAVFPVLAGD